MIILDLIGTLFLALGIYAQFGGEELLFSEFLDIRPFAIILMLIGLLLMMPLVMNLMKQSISAKHRQA
jgi:hypothetical protein